MKSSLPDMAGDNSFPSRSQLAILPITTDDSRVGPGQGILVQNAGPLCPLRERNIIVTKRRGKNKMEWQPLEWFSVRVIEWKSGLQLPLPPLFYNFIYLFIYLFTYSFIYLFIYLFTHLFIYCACAWWMIVLCLSVDLFDVAGWIFFIRCSVGSSIYSRSKTHSWNCIQWLFWVPYLVFFHPLLQLAVLHPAGCCCCYYHCYYHHHHHRHHHATTTTTTTATTTTAAVAAATATSTTTSAIASTTTTTTSTTVAAVFTASVVAAAVAATTTNK